MLMDRSSQILLLKKEFPKARTKGFRSTVFTIPLSSFYGRSQCVIEMNVPRDYPISMPTFKMVNPIPHKWSDGDFIKYPKDLADKPLVDLVWHVVSNFADYDQYVSGKRLHEDDRSTDPKLVDSFNKLTNDVVHSLNNPPTSSLSHVNSLSDARVKQVLESDSEVYRLIFKSESLREIVNGLKTRLKDDEENISSLIRNSKRKQNILLDMNENLDYLDKLQGKEGLKSASGYKSTLRNCLEREILTLQRSIDRKKESVYSGKKQFDEVSADLFKMLKKMNMLSVYYNAIPESQTH